MNADNLNVKYVHLHAIKVSAFQADWRFIIWNILSTTAHSLPYTRVEDEGGECCLHAKVLLQSGLKD